MEPDSFKTQAGGTSRGEADGTNAVRGPRGLKGWGVAVILALGWHGLWWLWLGISPPPPGARIPELPLVTYTPFTVGHRTESELHADVRVLWSPALFSLSSPVGFSRIMLENEIGARPVLNPPAGLSNLLERLAQSGTGPVIRIARPIREEAARARSADDAGDFAPAGSGGPAARNGGFQLEFSGGLKDAKFRNLQFPRNNPVVNRTSWQARAYLEFNDAGVVRHVMLDRPTSSKKLNQYIIRQLLALRLKNAGEGRSGYVRMVNAGAGATWADVDTGRAP